MDEMRSYRCPWCRRDGAGVKEVRTARIERLVLGGDGDGDDLRFGETLLDDTRDATYECVACGRPLASDHEGMREIIDIERAKRKADQCQSAP